MEPLCRECPNSCKEEATTGSVMKYCSIAPEGKQVLENIKRYKNGKKKNKSNTTIKQGGGEVVWNATGGKAKRNNQEAVEQPVADERQDRKVADL